MIEPWQIRLLGAFEVRQGLRQPLRFRTQRAAHLLAYLALGVGRQFSRDDLATLFWPDAAPDAAKHNLRQALSSLRTALEPVGAEPGSVLEGDRSTIKLNAQFAVVDVQLMERHLRSDVLDDIAHGVDLYLGELLPGVEEDWAHSERTRFADLYVHGIKRLVQVYQQRGEHSRALPLAQRSVGFNPLDEEAQGALIRLLADAGRPEDAVQQYREYRRILKRELGDDPDPRLRELALTLKGAKGSLEIDLDEVATTRAKTQSPTRRTLPVSLSPFFGQEEMLGQVRQLLDPTSGRRLITLTGPGGSGKTRIAVESARAAELYGQSVWFVALATVYDAHLALTAIWESVRDEYDSHAPSIDAVATRLEGVTALLVLDNLEQIGAEISALIQELLNRIPTLHLLCTSRKALRLPGEVNILVPPLPVPEDTALEKVTEVPSVQLFVDRARQAAPDFRLTARNCETIAELCRGLEGIPLALELAASWSGVLSPREMLNQMGERFELLRAKRLNKEERHASLWAAIDWSYSMIKPAAQHVFAQLSTFRGGWDLAAAKAVTGNNEVSEVLENLRHHALIQLDSGHDAMRWTILESLREFGQAQLSSEDLAQKRKLHAEWFAGRAREWHDLQRGADQQRVNDFFAADIDNIWAVIDRAVAGEIPLDHAYKAANYSYRYWEMRGQWQAARRAYERLLEADKEAPPTFDRSLALISLSNLLRQQGEVREAIPLTEECLRIRQALGDEAEISSALGNLAQLYKALGDTERAKEFYLRCMEMQEQLGTHWNWAMNCLNLGWMLALAEQWDEAQQWLEKGHAKMEELGDKWGIAAAAGNLGEVALGTGDLDRAVTMHRRSLSLFSELEDLPAIAEELEAAAHLAQLQMNCCLAATLFGAADSLRQKIGSHLSGAELERLDARMQGARKLCTNFGADFQSGRAIDWREAVRRASQ